MISIQETLDLLSPLADAVSFVPVNLRPPKRSAAPGIEGGNHTVEGYRVPPTRITPSTSV